MIKGLQKVTRMSVYFGEYKKTRKSGVSQWCKVVMYASPIACDPFDENVRYVQRAIEARLPYWLPDSAATDVILHAKEKGKKITDDKQKSVGYTLDENDIPQAYKYAFTELGLVPNSERVEFGKTLYKVDAEGKYLRDEAGKRISATGTTVVYWTGGDAIISGLTISKEYCMKRALSEWKEGVTSAPVITNEEPTKEVQQEVES